MSRRGRRVMEPVPKVWATECYGDSLTELANVWETVSKAKVELRKVEHRLGGVERAPVATNLNETGETTITDYSLSPTRQFRINQTYNITDHDNHGNRQFPSGATVDSHGWSKRVRSQKSHGAGCRKVSRLDDKYTGQATHYGRHAQGRTRSDRGRHQMSPEQQLPNRDPGLYMQFCPELGRTEFRGASPKRVDFNDHLALREINADGTYTDSLAFGYPSTINSAHTNMDAPPPPPPQGIGRLYSPTPALESLLLRGDAQTTDLNSYSTGNVTDPRAVRETEIRFLNDQHYPLSSDIINSNHGNRLDAYDVRWNRLASRLTHVDVTVPGVGVGAPQLYPSSSARPPPDMPTNAATTNGSTQMQLGATWAHGGGVLGQGRDDRRAPNHHPTSQFQDGYSSSASSHSEGGEAGRKLKKRLKDFDRNTDGLSKLKETIRQQRLAVVTSIPKDSGETTATNVHIGGALGGEIDIAQRLIHKDADPVQPRSHAQYVETEDPTTHPPRPRKVAAGPPTPVYKGFNEAESRYKLVKATEGSRKTSRRKPSQKALDRSREDDTGRAEDKPRKRVVASKERSAKPKQKDVITTSSWRSGQQVILQALGPFRSNKSSKGTTTSSDAENAPKPRDISQESHRPEPVGRSDQLEPDRPKVLSDEARKVLSDLQIATDDGASGHESATGKDSARDRRKHPAIKRKAKPPEPEKQQPAAKARHYDADSVRKYIAQQKEARLRRKKEEDQAAKQAEERRKKHLEELYNKQKPSSASHSLSGKRPEKQHRPGRGGESTQKTRAWPELAKHHPFHEDQPRAMVGGESDKENKQEVTDLNLSDSSSTLTNEDSLGDSTPVATPRADNSDRPYDAVVKSSRLPGGSYPDTETLVGRVGFYPSHSHETARPQGSNAHPQLGSSDHCGPLSQSAPPPSADLGLLLDMGQHRTRADRIRALKNTGATLQSRLQLEARKLGEPASNRYTTSSVPSASPQPLLQSQTVGSSSGATGGRDRDNRLTRHDKITGARDDYTVFNSNLPGVRNLPSHVHEVEQDKAQDSAATRIQALYRGHAVRQSLDNWKLPSGNVVGTLFKPNGRTKHGDYADSLEESSTFSDITITDESELESGASSPPRQIGAGLRERDFHSGDRYRREMREHDLAEQATLTHPPRPSRPVAEVCWDRPEVDPYSTINVLSRHYKPAENERSVPGLIGASERYDPMRQRRTDLGTEDQVTLSQNATVSEQARMADATGRFSPLGTRSRSPEPRPVSEVSRSEMAQSHATTASARQSRTRELVENSQKAESVADKLRTDDIRSRLASSSFHPPLREMNDADVDTVDGDSYTQSFESGDDQTPSNQLVSAAKESARLRENRKIYSSVQGHDSAESDISSMLDEEIRQVQDRPMQQPQFPMMSGVARSMEETSGLSALPARYSPNALERRMAAELNLLESMEESMRQVTNVERSRAVSMTQQETVSLAQILKSRQQAHELQMQELQLKARQESMEASSQLEEARKRSAEAAENAVQMIALVRGGQTSQSLQESTKKLIESQAEAARYLAEARGVGVPPQVDPSVSWAGAVPSAASAPSVVQKSRREMTSTNAAKTGVPMSVEEERSERSASLRSGSKLSNHSTERLTKSAPNTRHKSKSTSSRSVMSGSVRTASDSERSRDRGDGAIRTLTDADGKDESKSESIAEDLSYGKASADDYSMIFDESMTEDEIEEKSFRMLLPSESHRRKAKHHRTLSDVSITSEDLSVSSGKQGYADDMNSLFLGEDSFNRFTMEMVSQYMREEELRAQHQNSLLKLREKALEEKTRAELEWLEQQKRRIRDKGSDDAFPQIKKRQRGIKLKLEQQQAEIKRMQEANMAATKERRLIWKQQEELRKLRQTTKSTWEKVHGTKTGRGGGPLKAYRHDDIQTEDEASLALEGSDVGENTAHKDVKSDSEIYTEPKKVSERKKHESKVMTKLKNVHLDQRYLTSREKKLRDRRKNAEQLLAWKKKLDDEEAKIYQLEKQAIDLWDGGKGGKAGKDAETKKDATDGSKDKKRSKAKELERSTVSYGNESAVISEHLSAAKDDSRVPGRSESESSISEAVSRTVLSRTQTSKAPSLSLVAQDMTKSRHERSESEGSIPEEVQSQSSSNAEELTVTSQKLKVESVDDTTQNRSIHDTYADDTFVSESVTPSNKKSPLQKLRSSPSGLLFDPSRSPISPGKPFCNKRGSESESEDSVHAETASDQSDTEGRIRALKDELSRRKMQMEKLKKEQDKRQREKLKAHEESLLKQIEAYDNSIKQMTVDLQNELEHDPVRSGKKPQIKQPRGRDSKQRTDRQSDEFSPQKTLTPQKSESESSRSSQSSSFEENRESLDSTQTSPASVTEGSASVTSPHRKDLQAAGKKTSLESISERSEISASNKSGKLDLGRKEQDTGASRKDAGDARDEASEIAEDIDEASQLESAVSELLKFSVDTGEKFQFNGIESLEPIQASIGADKLYQEDNKSNKEMNMAALGQSASEPRTLTVSEAEPNKSSLSARWDLLPVSARSGNLSARSEISEYITENIPAQVEVSEVSEVSESSAEFEFKPLDLNKAAPAEAEKSLTKDNQIDEDPPLSHRSDCSYSSTKSEPTLSEKSEVSYTEDFSEVDVSGQGRRSSKSRDQGDEAPLESVPSEDEISEDLSVASGASDKTASVGLVFQTSDTTKECLDERSDAPVAGKSMPSANEKDFFDDLFGRRENRKVNEKEDYDKNPVQSPREDEGNDLINFMAGDAKDVSVRTPAEVDADDFQKEHDDSVATDSELDKVISTTAAAVEAFDSTPFSSPEHKAKTTKPADKVVDSITDQLMAMLLKDSFSTMGQIAAKKKSPPPTLPKPQRGTQSATITIMVDTAPGLPSLEPSQSQTARVSPPSVAPRPRASETEVDRQTSCLDTVMSNMVNEAISDMISIRRRKCERSQELEKESLLAVSETPLVNGGLGHHGKLNSTLKVESIPRPGSPLPSETPTLSKEDLNKLDEDLMDIYGDEDQYVDDDEWFHKGPPPPYPGTADQPVLTQYEEPSYVVPHNKADAERIVGSAVDVFWQRRRYGESLDDVEVPGDYFIHDDNGIDIDSKSRHSYKKLLFDLTGEIIREIYKEEEQEVTPPWQKTKRKQQKYYKGSQPPTTLDVLRKLVQDTAVAQLGLNGGMVPQSDNRLNKWGVRKKKDVVDSILVQELQEEEPHWVNYDDDEVAVKNQITDSLFNYLLDDTVQAMSKIFRKRRLLRDQEP